MRLWIRKTWLCALAGAIIATLAATPARAQAAPHSYQIRYAANLQFGDSFVDLTNTGGLSGFDPGGDICANIYAFDADQELVSCCTCPLTPNHLKSISIKTDVLQNLLTNNVPNELTVAILVSNGNAGCNAGTVTSGQTVNALRAWGTTIHALPTSGYAVTETPFSDAHLSDSELAKLTTYCSFIQADASFYGICKTCSTGGE